MQTSRQVLARGTGVALVTGLLNEPQANDAGMLRTSAIWLYVVGKAALISSIAFHWRSAGKQRQFLMDVYREVTTHEVKLLTKLTFEAIEAEYALADLPTHSPQERRMIDLGISVLTPHSTEMLRIRFTRSADSSELLVRGAARLE